MFHVHEPKESLESRRGLKFCSSIPTLCKLDKGFNFVLLYPEALIIFIPYLWQNFKGIIKAMKNILSHFLK